jgi:spermidine/putrescine-binding protein
MKKSISALFALIAVAMLAGAIWLMYLNPDGVTSTQPSATPPLAKALHLFIWEEYLGPEVRADFEREFGVKIIEENYASNEDLLAKLQAGAGGYDVIVPTDYMVSLMIKGNLLAALDLAKLPNLRHIGARFKNLEFDPTNQYSVPYLWGTTGIGYHAREVSPPATSWADLFEPARLEKYRGRISMLNDKREVIGAALLYLGYSPNTTDATQLEAAKQVLLQQKAYLAKYDSEAFEDSLAAGEMLLVQGWSGEITAARETNPEIAYVIPREGSLIFLDNLAIPKSSKNQDTAEVFINYLLRPDVAARITNYVLYASPNEAAAPLIRPDLLAGPAYALPEDVPLHWLRDLGAEADDLYDKIWTQVKSH